MNNSEGQTVVQPISELVKKLLLIGGAIFVVIVLIFGYAGIERVFEMFSGSARTADDIDGILVLTAITASTTTGETSGITPLVAAAYDGTVAYLPVDQLADGPAPTLQHAISRNGAFATFLAFSPDVSVQAPSVYRADISGKAELADVVVALQSGEMIASPNDDDYFREYPVISGAGDILYASLDRDTYAAADSIATLPADTWAVYHYDSASGERSVVARGLYPKWIDDLRFAYLKNDGVYMHDLSTGIDMRVWQLAYSPTLVNGFDVSDDGMLVAITDPASGDVSIVRVLDWDSGLLSLAAKIPMIASNPVFSPDSRYLALLQAAGSEGVDSTLARIRYYSLEYKNFDDRTISFGDGEIAGLYITDWR